MENIDKEKQNLLDKLRDKLVDAQFNSSSDGLHEYLGVFSYKYKDILNKSYLGIKDYNPNYKNFDMYVALNGDVLYITYNDSEDINDIKIFQRLI